MDLINQAIEWFKNTFYPDKPASPPKKIPSPFPKQSYKSQPDLSDIPEDSAKFAVRWFVSHGLSLEGASALTANLWKESFLNPTQLQISGKNKFGPGVGLAQWTDSTLTNDKEDDGRQRWDRYKNEFFPSLKTSHPFWKDYNMFDAEPQLSYIIHELENYYKGVWRELTSPGSIRSKSNAVLKRYEVARTRDDPEEQNFRTNLAEKIYTMVKSDKKLADLVSARKENKA